ARLMACVPPLALFAAFELVVRQIRSEVERGSVIASLNDMSERLGHLSSRRDALEGQVQQIAARRDSLKLELKETKSPSVHALLDIANTAKAVKISERLALVADLAAQGETPAEIARQTGVSAKTVKRDLARLEAA
ncbi:MAG: hypothetical protein JWR15_2312, partial [Prosthecobacter sp.]|nr:hypothetical protein [Prosthecobacter sp.]